MSQMKYQLFVQKMYTTGPALFEKDKKLEGSSVIRHEVAILMAF